MPGFGCKRGVSTQWQPATMHRLKVATSQPTPQSPRNKVPSGGSGSRLVAFAAPGVAAPEAAVIPEEEIIEMTKQFTKDGFRGDVTSSDMLDDDMIFRGPVIGPLVKSAYLGALTSFKLTEAFPDIDTKTFGYSVDPSDPYRVWFFSQITGTHTGPWEIGGATIPPSGGKIQNGTEASSIIWTPERKVRYISVGYCVDRINSNTPNGTMKIAVAGFLRAAGQGQLWDVITNPVTNWINEQVKKLQGKPPTMTPFEELPQWWRELPDGKLRDGEGYYK